MNKQIGRTRFVSALILIILCLAVPASPQGSSPGAAKVWGPRYEASSTTPSSARHSSPQGSLGRLIHWNEVAINSSGLDHTPVPLGDPRIFGEQLGPARAGRAIAIVHVAIFEAINAIKGG